VHSGRERCLTELSPKLGKPKKHPAYCVYLAYRLERAGGEEPGEATPRAAPWQEGTEEDEEAQQVRVLKGGGSNCRCWRSWRTSSC
jgi:hypothetical protein